MKEKETKDRFPLHRGNFWLCNRDHKEGLKWDDGFLNKNFVVHLQNYSH